MTEMTRSPLDGETEDFAQQIADQVESFLLALQAIARENDGGRAISLLLLEISQVLLAGARLGAQRTSPRAEYQPDVGPEPDLDEMRLRLAVMLDSVDTYSLRLRPLRPGGGREPALRRPHQHRHRPRERPAPLPRRQRRGGAVVVAVLLRPSWGNLAGAALNALLSVVSHDRLDVDFGRGRPGRERAAR